MAGMSEVVSYGIAGEEPSHEMRQPALPAAKEDMRMIAHQRPGINRCAGIRGQDAKSPDEIRSIRVIMNDRTLFNASNHHMMKSSWAIEPALPRHPFSSRGGTLYESLSR
jgi:hypothetical protein